MVRPKALAVKTPDRPRAAHAVLGMIGAIFVACAALSGCIPGKAKHDNGTLVFATDREPACLDPNLVGNMPQIFLARQYIDSVVAMDEQGRILPWLAKSWEISADRKVYTFHLRNDVTFSDGDRFNAKALKINLDRIVDPATQASTAIFLRDYDHTETPSEYVAVVHLSHPNESFLAVLAAGILGIESPRSLKRTREEICTQPIGSGPFRIRQWKRQQEVVLDRNPDYNWGPPNALHQGPAHVRRLEWKFISEPSVRYASLQSGRVDVIDSVPPEYEASARSEPDIAFLSADRPGTPTNGTLNTKRAPFDDIRVREAFIRSADIEAALKSIFFGLYKRPRGPLTETTPFHVTNLAEPDRYDPARAARLLDAAGWTGRAPDGVRTRGGKRLVVHVPIRASIDPSERALWEQVQATTRQVGFDVNLDAVSDNRDMELYRQWDYDIRLGYWNGNNPDILRLQFGSPAVGAPSTAQYHANGSGFSNARYDEVISRARYTADENARRALYAEAQRLIAYNFLQLRTYPQSTRLAIRKGVKGVHVDPALNLCTLYDAWVEQ